MVMRDRLPSPMLFYTHPPLDSLRQGQHTCYMRRCRASDRFMLRRKLLMTEFLVLM